jgi:hypothetical protein
VEAEAFERALEAGKGSVRREGEKEAERAYVVADLTVKDFDALRVVLSHREN